jgi:ATP-dependent exoDNAse (exonuclease V) beta subunit
MLEGIANTAAIDGPPAVPDDHSSAERLFGLAASGEDAEGAESEGAVSPGASQSAVSTAAANPEPVQFGRYVHEILATVDLTGKDLIPLAQTLARRYGLGEGDANRAVAMVERVLRLPLMGDARASTRVLREVATGAEARADLVFQTASGWHVVDFKTDLKGDPREHLPQVREYAARVASATQQKAFASVCLVRTGKVTE